MPKHSLLHDSSRLNDSRDFRRCDEKQIDGSLTRPLTEVTRYGQATRSQRQIRGISVLCLILISLVTYFGHTCSSTVKDLLEPKTLEERIDDILTATPLIDGHNDLAWLIRALYGNHIYSQNFTELFEDGGLPLHVDLPRLKKGKSGGAFWSAFVPCPSNWSDFSNANYAKSVESTLGQIDLLNRLHDAYPAHFSPTRLRSTEALAHFKANRLISPIGVEGLHQIGNSLSNLRLYHSLGVRYVTLTHNCHNIFADAALTEMPDGHVEVAKPHWGGLSPAGKVLVHEMNRLGMIVDLAHVSQDTMRDVLSGASMAPIMFSHSSAYSICPHPRNVPDDLLELVKATNSVVMVNFAPDFVSCTANLSDPSELPDFYPQNSTIEHVVEHIMHIGNLIGYGHVGIGSDFDGIGSTPRGLEDVSKYPALVAELLKRGVSGKDVRQVIGENVLRVWRDVEKTAEKLQAAGTKPAEDGLKRLILGNRAYAG